MWSNFPHAIFILRYGTIKNENAGVYMIKMVVICFILLQVDIVLSSLLMILMAYIGKKRQRKNTLQDWIKCIKKKHLILYLAGFELLRLVLFYLCIETVFHWLSIDAFLWETGMLVISFLTTAFRWLTLYRHRSQFLEESGL